MSLSIKASWHRVPSRPSSQQGASVAARGPSPSALEDVADLLTTAVLTLAVDGSVLTRMIDDRQDTHDGPRVSAYRFAEWLVWNWWRIRWEPGRGDGENTLSWRQAHETASIGGGWLWPRLEFDSDGQSVAIRTRGSTPSPTEPVGYLIDDPERYVRAQDFETGVDDFLRSVLSRLADKRVRKGVQWPNGARMPLRAMWDELQEERSDLKTSMHRRIEALLGHSPDEAPAGLVEQLLADARRLGESAAGEVAAEASLGTTLLTAEKFSAIADAHGVEISKQFATPMTDSTRTLMESGMPGTPMAAWEVGENAARAFRASCNVGDGPLSDATLSDLCGVRSFAFQSRRAKVPMAFTLSEKGTRRRMVFRANVLTGRRFEAARLLGDKMLVRNSDRLQPGHTDAYVPPEDAEGIRSGASLPRRVAAGEPRERPI